MRCLLRCRLSRSAASALPSYRVDADGRPRPRSAAMAQAAVRAREKGGSLSSLSPSRAREAGADCRRRFLFHFLPFSRASEPTAPKSDGAGRRPCRRRSATPSALPSYRVDAAGRPRPRSAAMAQAAVRAREKGGLLSTLSPSRAREARADSRRRFHFHFCLSAGRASRRRRSRTALADARAGGGAQRQARCRATGSTPLAARAPDPPRWPRQLCALGKRGDCCQLCHPRARARRAPIPDDVFFFIFAFQQGERADGAEVGRRWPTPVPAAERNAKRAAELPGRRRWPPAPPIRRDGPGSCARSGKGGIVVNFVTLARARGARRLQTTFSFSFLPFSRASEPTAPKSDGAGRRPCRRRSATPSALPSYRVDAAGRPRPRSAAMAQAAVLAREKGAR